MELNEKMVVYGQDIADPKGGVLQQKDCQINLKWQGVQFTISRIINCWY